MRIDDLRHWLKEERIKQGLTQKQLEEMLEEPADNVVCHIEVGRKPIFSRHTLQILDALGYEMDIWIKRKE